MAEAANKIAVVTGAGTGVGRAASLALMNAGFTVVLAGRRMEMLDETKKLGDNVGKSLAVSADMTDPGSIAALFAKVMDSFGRLDVLFNNAGIGAPAQINEEDTTAIPSPKLATFLPPAGTKKVPPRLLALPTSTCRIVIALRV